MTDPNDPINPCEKNTLADLQAKASGFVSPYENESWKGLTKREYFAAMAMVGVSREKILRTDVARISVEMADALIAELNKEPK